MKAISLWQPWASAVAVGAKRIETRSWPTAYRGPLAIHAAKRMVKREMKLIKSQWPWIGALEPFRCLGQPDMLWELLPFGCLVGICVLTDCKPVESFSHEEVHGVRKRFGVDLDCFAWTESDLGDFTRGRFGWVLTNNRSLRQPIPWKGAQGFFEVPDHVLKQA